jgi:predicted lipoprotein with Yx(FWY)xxD motif
MTGTRARSHRHHDNPIAPPPRQATRPALAAGTLAATLVLGLALAACTTKGSGTGSSTNPSGAGAAVTIASANVPGVGTVLVNGQGRTIYVLTSEQGGKLTCTDANGCTKVWPDTELPSGVTAATAGSGVQAAMLGTVKDASGSLYVTYATYPLYTYVGDTGPGTASGEGITSLGGTWYPITPAGTLVKTKASSGSGY